MRFLYLMQGCENTMPDLSDRAPFHSGQFEIFYLLVLRQMYKVNIILYFIFRLIIKSSKSFLYVTCLLGYY